MTNDLDRSIDIGRLYSSGTDQIPYLLPSDEIHIVDCHVDLFSSMADRLLGILAEVEKEKANSYRFPEHRDEFIVTRSLLRILLGNYSRTDPRSLEFHYGPHGKPTLGWDREGPPIGFSVSHSHRRALYAFTRGREIGVDLEKIRCGLPVKEISERFFTQREAGDIHSVSEDVRDEIFFSYWTLKEAYLKGTGEGFSLPLDQFEVSLDPPQVVSVQGNRGKANRWSLRQLHLHPDYAAGIAVKNYNIESKHLKLQLL